MADISKELQKILSAVYGEEVRGSIHDAIELINSVSESTLSTGTAVTSAASSIEGYYKNSVYLNVETDDLWKCDGTKWVLQNNIKGISITDIKKTATDGFVDTYTIYFSDGSTTAYEVTNGRGITDFKKTGTDVLTDKYEVDFSDNTKFKFTVSNGRGIVSIKKISTDVLTDTYRISLNDNTHVDFSVINGAGITDIKKTGTDVLTDTYTIYLSDNTEKTFTVKNGAGISKIEKTKTIDLTDIYTVYLNDNTQYTFSVVQGVGISTFTKTGTKVLTDTYKFTMNDGTEYTFSVNNGRGISNFEKTKSEGLKDIYLMSFNDGTDYSFEVNNGRGIEKFSLKSKSGLINTYTMLFNDGTSVDISIKDGNGIASIEKTGASGLTDIYTITFGDGTTWQFNVVNGFSPTVEVSKSGTVTTVIITDINGPHEIELKDGDGDMSKATYDKNNNGIVDEAEKVEWNGVQNVPYDETPTEKSENLMKSKDIKRAIESVSVPGFIILDKKAVSISLSESTAEVNILYATGTASVSSSNPKIKAVVNGNTITISGKSYTHETAVITVETSAGNGYEAAAATIQVDADREASVYGVSWDGTSTTKWSRTDAAESFTDPIPAVGNGTGSSPFDEISPWKDIVKEERTGGTMVKIPKFYYKLEKSGKIMNLQISPEQQEGFSVSPAHMDRGDGKGERDYIYVGRYHCAASTYKSTTGVKPQVNMTRSASRQAVHNLGDNIWQYDYMTLLTIQMLYLVEFADWNSQACIGYGCAPDGSTSAVRNMGYTDAMQYHTGTDQAERTTYGGTQYRYMEGLWDNCFDWCDGVYFGGTDVYAIKNPADFSDTAGGTKVGTRPISSSYISEYEISDVDGFEYFMYPSATAGSDSTYVCDYCYCNASGVVLCVGGSYGQYQSRGLFCLYGNYSATGTFSYRGSRLLELP